MDIAELIAPDAVILDVAAPDLRALTERAATLIGARLGVAPRLIQRTLTEREALGSTGFGGGVAIPHGRVPGLERVTGTVLRLARPIDWRAIDDLPVTLAVVLLGPEDAGVEHLKALALVSRLLRNRSLVARLKGAESAEALWALLAGDVDKEAA